MPDSKRKRARASAPMSTAYGSKPPEPGTYGATPQVIRLVPAASKRGRGKPPLPARLERDRIVAYVEHLKRTCGRKLTRGELTRDIVPAAASFFGVDVQTVWRALREYSPFGSIVIEVVGQLVPRGSTSGKTFY